MVPEESQKPCDRWALYEGEPSSRKPEPEPPTKEAKPEPEGVVAAGDE
jgi:hypothetical protein